MADLTNKSRAWFRNIARTLTDLSGHAIMNAEKENLRRNRALGPSLIGSMILYFYDPKHKETLPYYDTFPLVIPLRLDNDGFLGLNLHYLPPRHRAILFDLIVQVFDRNKNKQTKISYDDLVKYCTSGIFKPCVKQYLYGHVRSRFRVIPKEEWNIVLMMPLERFVKRSKSYVQAESMRIAGRR